MRLTNQIFWDESYKNTKFEDLTNHDVAVLLKNNLKKCGSKSLSSIELGSFPGNFQPTLGRLGYKLNGVDFNSKNETLLPQWLRSFGFQVDNFTSKDIEQFVKENKKKFDLVCSFGLIEHFSNFESMIQHHINLVEIDGYIVITTPNFRGLFQNIIHNLFDKNNLAIHYLPSMNPYKWKNQFQNNNIEIVYCGYFGGFKFWVADAENMSKIRYISYKIVNKFISALGIILNYLNIESSLFSAYCGIIGVKKNY